MGNGINNNASRVRVLLVEDSPVELAIIRKSLEAEPDIEIVGTAMNGAEALPLVRSLRPDVICTDYHMPVMDGLEFTERVMAEAPCPILVLSISVQPSQTLNILHMIEAGAIDVMHKPIANAGGIHQLDGKRLAEKIRILKGVHCIPLKAHKTAVNNRDQCLPIGVTGKGDLSTPIICIGSSTGGPQALYRILPQLPKGFPIPVVCVQHISVGFLHGLIEWLAPQCAVKLSVAAAGEKPEAGCVYFAPEGKNLKMDAQGAFVISEPEPADIHVPNIDMLFMTASVVHHGCTIGVILSGMGSDGVRGMRAIRAQGGHTLVQDEATSVIFGMPGSVIAAGVAEDILPIELIAPALVNLATKQH